MLRIDSTWYVNSSWPKIQNKIHDLLINNKDGVLEQVPKIAAAFKAPLNAYIIPERIHLLRVSPFVVFNLKQNNVVHYPDGQNITHLYTLPQQILLCKNIL